MMHVKKIMSTTKSKLKLKLNYRSSELSIIYNNIHKKLIRR